MAFEGFVGVEVLLRGLDVVTCLLAGAGVVPGDVEMCLRFLRS